uniref:Uncharacterized protein n=1 Tax=Meloidogyne javanica TaxID=6303 RepID=A0A915MPU4_MELJA
MNMELCGNGKLVMVMNVFFVFLLMFVGTLEEQNKYPNLLKPYKMHIYPCPNCALWCKYNPMYTCTYSCDHDIYYDTDSKFGKLNLDNITIEEGLSHYQKHYDMHEGWKESKLRRDFYDWEHYFAVRGTPEIEQNIKKVCADTKTYNCTFGTLGHYPIGGCGTSFPWGPYIRNESVIIVPKEDPKYWALYSSRKFDDVMKKCHL